MTNHDKPTNTNFWFGFALGSITLTVAAYMLGTKKGREKLKQLLEYTDTIEDMPEELFALLPKIKEMLKKEADSVLHQGKNEAEVTTDDERKGSFTEQVGQSLESIIEKVKHSSEETSDSSEPKTSGKKYFIKSET